MAEVVLVRHGETQWSRSGQHTGRTDIPLTDHGRAQARHIGQLLAERQFALVLTSPRQRAMETCRLSGYADVAQTVAELSEWDYGDYEGKTTDQIRALVPNWTVWTHPCPGGETAAQVGARADQVIEVARAAAGDVLLFGHGHLLRVLAARWCGLAPTDGRLLMLDPATLSVLGYERQVAAIRRWNEECGSTQ